MFQFYDFTSTFFSLFVLFIVLRYIFAVIVQSFTYYFREWTTLPSPKISEPVSSLVDVDETELQSNCVDSGSPAQCLKAVLKIRLNDISVEEIEGPAKLCKPQNVVSPIPSENDFSNCNLNTLFEQPENSRPASIDSVEVVDMEICPPIDVEELQTPPNSSKGTSKSNADSLEVVDMELCKSFGVMELTPLPKDFGNLNLSKSTDLSISMLNESKPYSINDFDAMPNLFQESFRDIAMDTTIDSCFNISLNEDLKVLEESGGLTRRSIDIFGNISFRNDTVSSRGDSAFGSEVADESQQPETSSEMNQSSHMQLEDLHKENVPVSKPALYSSGVCFTTVFNIQPEHKFKFNASKIPVMKELEYRRKHSRSVEKK